MRTLLAPCYVAVGQVHARQLDDSLLWTATGGDRLKAKKGDWLLTDADNPSMEAWTVEDSVFRATYEQVEPGCFRKAVQVRAIRLGKDAIVETREGDVSADVGDWLVTNPTGESWAVTAAEFSRRYREASAT